MYQHNEEAKEKISEASIQHWKDDKYREKTINGIKESYTPELRQKRSDKLKEMWQDPEFRAKMIEERKQRYKTQEAKDNHSRLMKEVRKNDPTISNRQSVSIRAAMSTQEYRKKRSEISKAIWDDDHKKKQSKLSSEMWKNMSDEDKEKRIKKIIAFNKDTFIERKVQEQLRNAGIVFDTQVPILGGKYFLDIVIPDKNIAIECNGDYWHNLPERIERDKNLAIDIFKTQYTLITLWEHDIKSDNFDIFNYLDNTALSKQMEDLI